MRFEQLRYFVAAARSGSLRRAAALLGVTQPTLSEQLQRLEEELNVILFNRGPHGVSLTHAGEVMLAHANSALSAEAAMHQEATSIGSLTSGRLRLGSVATGGLALLPEAIRIFRAQSPRIQLETLEAGSATIRAMVRSGELDVGVVGRWPDEPEPDGLRSDELATGPLVICLSPGHPLTGRERVGIRDLEGESFVVTDAHHDLLAEAFRTIHSGIGVGIHAEVSWGVMFPEGPFVILDEPWAQASIAVVRRESEQSTPAVMAFIRALRDSAHSIPAKFPPRR